MVKHFNIEGIKKFGGVKYKPHINVEEGKDSYILLDLLWISKHLAMQVLLSLRNNLGYFIIGI